MITFRCWLMTQTRRDDPVGDLARDYAADIDRDPSLRFDALLKKRGASPKAFEAYRYAHAEWTMVRRKPTLTLHAGHGKNDAIEALRAKLGSDYDELARRLLAAWWSYLLGNKSIDYTLKTALLDGVSPENCFPGQFWQAIARDIVEEYRRGNV